jgi:rhomboid family GlyGly-CTERM serine protease
MTSAESKRVLTRCVPIAALALLAWVASVFPSALELDRAALADGEWWRLWTGHLVHGSAAHYVCNVGALAALGFVLGGLGRLLWLAPLVGLGLFFACSEVEWYYGLSAALHGWLIVEALAPACAARRASHDGQRSRRQRGRKQRVWALLAFGVFTKAGLEATFGTSLLTDGVDFGGPVLYVSHFVGAVVGLAAGTALAAGRASSLPHVCALAPTGRSVVLPCAGARRNKIP